MSKATLTNPNDPRPQWLKTLIEVLRLVAAIAAAIVAALAASGCQLTVTADQHVLSTRLDVLTTITPSIVPVETTSCPSDSPPTKPASSATAGSTATAPPATASQPSPALTIPPPPAPPG